MKTDRATSDPGSLTPRTYVDPFVSPFATVGRLPATTRQVRATRVDGRTAYSHTWSVPTPPPIRSVRFEVRSWGAERTSAREVLPYVDNVSLVDLVRGYELEAGYDVPGAYAGILLAHFKFGDLTSYLTGTPEADPRADRGMIALLGCDCGVVDCWPLKTRVLRQGDLITWHGFAQPHRSNRDYRSFGPFMFQRAQYERAVHEAATLASMIDG